jgi:hypothetical protein
MIEPTGVLRVIHWRDGLEETRRLLQYYLNIRLELIKSNHEHKSLDVYLLAVFEEVIFP